MTHVLALLAAASLQVPVPVRAVAVKPGDGGPTSRTGVVSGQVLSGVNGPPLPLASVELVGDGGTVGAVTDNAGHYVLEGVPAGPQVLRASHIGHAPLEVQVVVPPGGQLNLDFALEVQPVALPAVTARVGGPTSSMDTVEISTGELGRTSVQALESTPGMVEMGLGDVAHGTPANDPVDPSDVLYVRGAAADLKLVLLDGAPVYAPFNLGGLVQPFEADVLSSARLYLGGAPARYDGGLSYVLSLQTRGERGDRVRTLVNVNMLSARTRVEGPLGPGAGFVLSTRTIHGLGPRLLDGGKFPYGYTDGILRLDRDVPGGGTITATGFGNLESVKLDAANVGHGTASWGNQAGSIRYMGPLLGGDADLTVGVGRFSAGLPIEGASDMWVDGAATRLRVAVDLSRSAGPADIHYGVNYERQWLDYRSWARASVPDSLLQENRVSGDVAGTYVDASWQALPQVRVRGGMRVDLFSQERAPFIAPRLLITWLVDDNTAITVAGGRYHQYVRAPETVLTSPVAGQPQPPPSEGNPLLDVAGATHIVLSLDQQLPEGVRLGVEGYHKMYDGLPTDANGRAQESGVDFWIRRNRGTFQGWLGYSLSWIWSSNGQPSASDIFSGRHLISAGLLGPAGRAGRFQVTLTYGAGLPFTAIQPGSSQPPGTNPALSEIHASVAPAPLVASPDKPYLRIDGEVSHTWLTHWLGGPTFVTPYLRVLNALNRRDAMFYYFDGRDQSQPQALAALPVVPVVGVGFRF